MKGMLKWPLIIAAVFVVARILLEQAGAPNGVNNLFSVVVLYLLVGPLYFAVRIASSGIARPYLIEVNRALHGAGSIDGDSDVLARLLLPVAGTAIQCGAGRQRRRGCFTPYGLRRDSVGCGPDLDPGVACHWRRTGIHRYRRHTQDGNQGKRRGKPVTHVFPKRSRTSARLRMDTARHDS